jgi:hypothetical protein
MAETVEDLTVAYTEGGIEVVKELDKAILTKGAWSTIVFRYREWDARKEAYGPDRYTIRRYQKRNDRYMPKAKFNISSADQARKLIDILGQWTADAGEG